MKKIAPGMVSEPHSWKPRAPEMEPEPCSCRGEVRSWSRSCVIFTTVPQPCLQSGWT